MLKALELYGFKSFADKTRFEFPDGITVVVGPNGSGKSNVVDAIRWVLGEQSAKSLRGAEMADVIFKGSGNSQRKPANTAEATIIFDNASGHLDIDSPEVRVTRRVYRSGEGEYLINAEPCRLRDIRDLFRGTGVGTDAYSLIEQGKVDTLLQASPRERRAIFEEAAGISRFKAKKVESQRRLERVEQNLLRLSDIVEEVERRLKSLRNQATKARRYREYTERLQELRTHVGLTDFRAISLEWDGVEQKLTAAQSRLARLEAAVAEAEQQLSDYDQRLAAIQTESRTLGESISSSRQSITSHQARIQLQHDTLRELESEQAGCRKKLMAVHHQAGDVQLQLHEVREQLALAERQLGDGQRAVEEQVAEVSRLQATISSQQAQFEELRQNHARQLESATRSRQELNQLESQLSLVTEAIRRERQRDEELLRKSEDAVEDAQVTEEEERRLKSQLDEALHQQAGTQTLVSQQVVELEQLKGEQAEIQTQLAAASERANVLEEVERRSEGIGAGTKDLLSQAGSRGGGGVFAEVCGMVADLIEVKVEMAPLIDAALGERAQFVVVSGLRLVRDIAAGSVRLRGRVGLIPLPHVPPGFRSQAVSLVGKEGVLGRATDFMQVDAQWRDLAEYLLGSTWLVRSLEDAFRLREQHLTHECRFVTSAGEVLESDGTVFGGPRLSSGGIVSRRSELRALRGQIAKHTEQVQILGQKLSRQVEQHRQSEQRLVQWSTTQKQASDAYADIHARAEAARQLVRQHQSNRDALQEELTGLQQQRKQLSRQQQETLRGLGELEARVTELQNSLNACQAELASLTQRRQLAEQTAATQKIELAQSEQRVEALRMQAARCQQDNDDRSQLLREIQQQLQASRSREADTSQAILRATSVLAEIYLRHQIDEQRLQQLRGEEDEIIACRQTRASEAKAAQRAIQQDQNLLHTLQMQSGELRLKRDAVAERLREDYGIELADLHDELAEEAGREQVDAEIGELRRKISNIGAVNMESLAELEDLEQRFGSLSTQYRDLIEAKESLERIIQRINVDSRRLFLETLETIRLGFQSLFRRAFGGGVADIVVEEGVDILDAGIDIVATPPGKHSLNISLLSGGERALTAVTLLLAIFRHRPSPFCILDEVDGPLDEANIGRFVDVLREFLATTKVVIVTHSKKTMSAATTLYGVTMQESGVSKRVSVQFNDVREDGSIRRDAAEGNDSSDGEAA